VAAATSMVLRDATATHVWSSGLQPQSGQCHSRTGTVRRPHWWHLPHMILAAINGAYDRPPTELIGYLAGAGRPFSKATILGRGLLRAGGLDRRSRSSRAAGGLGPAPPSISGPAGASRGQQAMSGIPQQHRQSRTPIAC
jgi:hypothetical protein